MSISDLDLFLLVALALALPSLAFWPLRRILSIYRNDGFSADDRVICTGGLSLLITFCTLIVLIDPLFVSRDILSLVWILMLAATVGFAEQCLRLPSQFTIANRLILATLCYLSGYGFNLGEHYQLISPWHRVMVDLPVTLFFYLGVMMSLEIFDRLHGLATGVTMIMAGSLLGLVMYWAEGNSPLPMLAVGCVSAGHLLLLQWDRRMKLGKAGQLQIAIMLAASTVLSRSWTFTLTMIFIPLIAVIVPIMDRIYFGLWRLSRGRDGEGPAHLHSMLLNIGFTERWLVFFIWIATLQVGVLINVVYMTRKPIFAIGAGLSAPLVLIFLMACLSRLGEKLERRRGAGRLRILFLSHYFHPEVNAPASRLAEHARHWTASGHEVTVVCPVPSAPHGWPYPGYRNSFWAEENINGVRVVRVWTFVAANRGRIRRVLNYVSYMTSALFALVFLRRHDVLVATSPQFFCGLAGAIASLFRREPFILEVRDLWPDSLDAVDAGGGRMTHVFLHKMASWMYRRADAIITVGEGYRSKLLERNAGPADRIVVIPNGVDPHFLQERKGTKNEGNFVVSYVGTVGMAHGLGVVVSAAELLRHEPVTFVIAGDGAERTRLEKAAEERGLANIRFLGLLPKQEIPALIAESDCCLVHLKKRTLFETVLPSKLFEALAGGRPVLLGVAGFSKNLLEEIDAGIAFEPENADELAAAIRRLMADPEEAAAMGARGREHVRLHYSRERFAEEYLSTIRDLMPVSGPLRGISNNPEVYERD